MKRIRRNRYLTPDKAAKYRRIRNQIQANLPDLIEQQRQCLATATRKAPERAKDSPSDR